MEEQGYFDKRGNPMLEVVVSGPSSTQKKFDAIIDTGFTGFLLLPMREAHALHLSFTGVLPVQLADGSTHDTFRAEATIAIGEKKRTGPVVIEGQAEVLL